MEIKNNNKWYQSLPFSPKHSLKHKHQTQSKRRFQALFRVVGVALGRFNASLGIRIAPFWRCSFCGRPLRRFDAVETLMQALSAQRCHDAGWRRIETPVWRHSPVKKPFRRWKMTVMLFQTPFQWCHHWWRRCRHPIVKCLFGGTKAPFSGAIGGAAGVRYRRH